MRRLEGWTRLLTELPASATELELCRRLGTGVRFALRGRFWSRALPPRRLFARAHGEQRGGKAPARDAVPGNRRHPFGVVLAASRRPANSVPGRSAGDPG